jgi:predicted adenine nucleotide alpha hydrolase (AANH) superfamily ATPase
MQKYCGCIFSAPKYAQCQAVSLDKKQNGEKPKNGHCDLKGGLALASTVGE